MKELTPYVAVAVALFILFLVILTAKFRVTPIVLTVLSLGQILVGYSMLDTTMRTQTWLLYTAGIVALVLGYFALHPWLSRRASVERAPVDPRVSLWFSVFILAFVVYHFVVGGIPILSSNVEVTRFSFSESGLMGIPSRMYLYGLPILVMYASLSSVRTSQPYLFRVVWAAYIISRLLSGFKGSVMELLNIQLMIMAFQGRPVRLHQLVSAKYLLPILMAVGWAVGIAFLYPSLHLSSLTNAVAYLVDRIAIQSALPGYYAITVIAHHTGGTWYILSDFAHFLSKYFHVLEPHGPTFTLEQTVSSLLTGVPLSAESYIVPVTVGGLPSLYPDLGLFGSLLVMAAVGGFYAYACTRSARSRSPLAAACWGYAAWRVNVYVLNGGLAYEMVNSIAVFAMLAITYRIICVSSQLSVRSPSRMPLP